MRTILKAHMFAVLVIGTFLGLLPWLAIVIFGYGRLQLNSTVAITLGVILAAAGASLSYSCMSCSSRAAGAPHSPRTHPRNSLLRVLIATRETPCTSGTLLGGSA